MSDSLILIIILLVVLAGSLLQSVFGFGFSLVVMAIFPLFMAMNKAVIYNLVLALISNAIIVVKLFGKICWKELLPMLVPTLAVCIGTAIWAVNINTVIMYFLLGCMLFCTALYFFVFTDRIQIKARTGSGVIVGIICGFLGGLFSLAGPAAAMYLLPVTRDKEKFTATIQAFFFMLNLVNLVTRIIMGTMEVSDVLGLSLSSAIMLAGTFIGFRLGNKLKGEWFTKGVYTLVGLNGI